MAESQLMAQAGSLSQGLLAEGSMRRFSLSLDLKRFQASSRLPLNLATLVLELTLPPELAGMIQQSNGRLPPRLSPLRTQAVQVARGSEAVLPGGQAAVDFTAGLMSVATMLSRGLVMTVDMYHRERLADDLLLGRAHVPLAPLLQESWVDGQAGVFALVPSTQHPGQHERVQVGTLHLVMSLEEAGPAAPPSPPPVPAPVAAVPAVVVGSPVRLHPASAGLQAAVAAAAAASRPHSPVRAPVAAAAAAAAVAAAGMGLPPVVDLQQPQLGVQPSSAPAPAFAGSSSPGGVGGADSIVGSPEFEAAWQLEVWKREEEVRWRQDLKAREAKRMAALEDTWRRREAEREAEASALRTEYAALEAKTRQVLAAAEEREGKVVAAEEAVIRRRRELEREHAGRVAEAEAAVRRLQTECQHQLELEAQRRQHLQQQLAAAEQRVAAAEARAAEAERGLQQFKEQHGAGEAGRLEGQLAAAKLAAEQAEARASKAAEGKRKYKQQVVRLAQEVALLQQQLAEVVGVRREQLDAELAKLRAEEQALAASRDAAEMAALKRQLLNLQVGGCGSGIGSAGSSGGGDKENAAGGGSGVAGDGCGSTPAPGSSSKGGSGGGMGSSVLQGPLGEAVQRLLRERELLLGSGAYSSEDPLIQKLDQRIRECAALAQGS